ncbi:MAG: peptidylprolyl isomerase [Candidatus Melainabacteria bacterium]|nr:peptidylprolyl isomerase [Candidatus Melainabacteria bacterium]
MTRLRICLMCVVNQLRLRKFKLNEAGLGRKQLIHRVRSIIKVVSSFSILLGDAPHLDRQCTVFGRTIPDAVTMRTINNIIQNWAQGQPWIVGTKEVSKSIASISSKE